MTTSRTGQLRRTLEGAGCNRGEIERALDGMHGFHRSCAEYLVAHMPAQDLRSLSAEFLRGHIDLACQARDEMPWGAAVPEEIFLEHILPYAHVNERREAWRANLLERCAPLVRTCASVTEAAQTINRVLFPLVGVRYHATRRRINHQSPSESRALGYASCTGLSILLADALRSVCVPARLVGVPQWSDTEGNHTWVEFWDGQWFFIGAAEPGELNATGFIERAARMDCRTELHRIYAVAFAPASTRFPMVWNLADSTVHAHDVTRFYTSRVHVELYVFDRPGGVPATATVLLRQDGRLYAQGRHTRGDSGVQPVVFELPSCDRFDLEVVPEGGPAARSELRIGQPARQRHAVYCSGAPAERLHAVPAMAPRAATAPLPRDIGANPLPAFMPRGYVCMRATGPMTIDGRLDEPAWQQARWTDFFVDIEGPGRPIPRFKTRAKMLWDDEYLYVAAEIGEPHVWAAVTTRNAVIFNDNDFEVFIDPDGDGHEYFEFEMNALNTVWNLLLDRPYKNGGKPVVREMEGQKSGVHVRGTLNNPRDTDDGWTLEIAFPWKAMAPHAHCACPPRDGDQWRMNFSRVEWEHEVVDGTYRRVPGALEDNWVWSPQGVVNMHRPETWGYVQFSLQPAGTTDPFRADPTADARWMLHAVHYVQEAYRARHGRYAATLADLGSADLEGRGIAMTPCDGGYQATAVAHAGGATLDLAIGPDARIACIERR